MQTEHNETLTAQEFMKLIDGDVEVARKLVDVYFKGVAKSRKNALIEKVDYHRDAVKITYSFHSEHMMSEVITGVFDTVSYDYLYDLWLAEYPTKQAPQKPMVVTLCKSEVAALARMFNDGAYRVQLEVHQTGIGVKLDATPMQARGFELEPGETKDITNYDNW